MQETPCLGSWQIWRNAPTTLARLDTAYPVWHPSLRRRILNVFSCPAFGVFDIIALHAYKTNVMYYWVKVVGFYVGPIIDPTTGRLLTRDLVFNLPPACYYIGKFPVYWVLPDNRLGFAHELAVQTRFPIATKPTVPPFFDNIFLEVPRAQWSAYLPDYAIETYLAQEKALKAMADWQGLCLNENYPPEIKEKTPYVSGYGPQPVPLIDTPIADLKLPTPEQPEGPGQAMSPYAPLFVRYWEEKPFLRVEFWL